MLQFFFHLLTAYDLFLDSIMEVDKGIVSFKKDEDFVMYESELPPSDSDH
jgi:hypothetical protein